MAKIVEQEKTSQQESVSYELGLKIRDLEENQKLNRERILLIGQNLIDLQEKNVNEIIELKKIINDLKTDVQRLKSSIQVISEEVGKSARREEIAILSRQFRMFEPLKYVRIEDIEKIINEKLNKHKNTENNEKNFSNQENQHEFWRGKI
ncbi:MAG TPA: hypothetical protein P5277_03730 [Candidatus Paceibacterota bacterium]|nr:hypothetical protein [Candidatus Paceibacterota bacterium]